MRFKKQSGSSLLMAIIIATVVAVIITGMSYRFLIQKSYIQVSMNMAKEETLENSLSDIKKSIINHSLGIKNADVSLNLNQINNGFISSHINELNYGFKYTFKNPNILYNSNSLYTSDAYIDYTELEEIVHDDSQEILIKNNISGHFTVPVTQTYRDYTDVSITPISVPLIDINKISKLSQAYELDNQQITDQDVGFIGAFIIDESGLSFVSIDGGYRSPNIEIDRPINNAITKHDEPKISIGWELSNGKWELYLAIYSAIGVYASHTSLEQLINSPNLAIIDLQLNLQIVKEAKNDNVKYTPYWYNAKKNNINHLYLAIIQTIQSTTQMSLNFNSFNYQKKLNKWLPDGYIEMPTYKFKSDSQTYMQILNIDEEHNLSVSKTLIFILNDKSMVLSSYIISNTNDNTSINYSPIFNDWFIPKNHNIINSPSSKGTLLYAYKENLIGRFIIDNSGYIYLDNQIASTIESSHYDIYSNYNSLIVSSLKSTKNQKYDKNSLEYVNMQSNNLLVEYSPVIEKRLPNNKTNFDLIYDIEIGKLYLKINALKCRLHILNGNECSPINNIYIDDNLVPSIHSQSKAKISLLNKIKDGNANLQLEYLYFKEQPKNIIADVTYAICSIRNGDVVFFSTKKISKNLNIQSAELKGYLTTNSIRINASHLINNGAFEGHLLSVVPIDYKSKTMPEYSVVCEIKADDGKNYIYKTLS